MHPTVIKGSGFNSNGGGFSEIIIDGVGHEPNRVRLAVTAHDGLIRALQEIASDSGFGAHSRMRAIARSALDKARGETP